VGDKTEKKTQTMSFDPGEVQKIKARQQSYIN